MTGEMSESKYTHADTTTLGDKGTFQLKTKISYVGSIVHSSSVKIFITLSDRCISFLWPSFPKQWLKQISNMAKDEEHSPPAAGKTDMSCHNNTFDIIQY